MDVFDRARFTAVDNSKIADETDIQAKQVLKTFAQLHGSWLLEKDIFAAGTFEEQRGMQSYYHPDDSSFYFTRALFGVNIPASYIVKASVNVRSIRTDNDPAFGPLSNQDLKDRFIFGSNTLFTPRGDLLGVAETGELERQFSYLNNQGTEITGAVKLGLHSGGGILGSSAYLINTVQEERNFRSNNDVEMPRKWSRAIYHDLFCRELPVVRTEDAVPFVVTNSLVAYRQTANCTNCHASIDRMSALIRGFRYDNRSGRNSLNQNLNGGNFVSFATPDRPVVTGWPAALDADYYRRPPSGGRLFYRNFNGDLVDIEVNSLGELGDVISNQDDFYACLVKRYYNFFTGINVPLGDPAASGTPQLNNLERQIQVKIMSLAQSLKTHQSLRTLIFDILKDPDFKRRDYGSNTGDRGL